MKGDMNQPIKQFPDLIKRLFIEEAEILFSNLKSNKLKVVLVPAPNPNHYGHKIRAVERENPEWYKILYRSYPHFRRDRSLKALNIIMKLKDKKFSGKSKHSPYRYHAIYRELIFKRLTEGYIEDGYKVHPRKELLF